MTKRTDIHRPSVINPGDYTLTGTVFDLKYDNLETMEVGTKPYGHCNHCGKAIRWAVEFLHQPTNQVVVFGEICADILNLSDSRSKHELVLLKRRVAALEKKLRREQEREDNYKTFKLQHPEVVEELENLYKYENNGFFRSLKSNLEEYGMLTTRQVEAYKRVMEARDRLAEAKRNEVIPTTPVKEGRYEVSGEVFTLKVQYGFYGDTLKMGVKLPDGNKVWGTVPRSLNNLERGHKIRFTATVEQSKDDVHFGFFSRPAKAERVN